MNYKKRSFRVLASAGITIAMVAGFGAGVAQADPPGATSGTPPNDVYTPTAFRPIAMVGSETATPIMNALGNDPAALAISGAQQVASFNATGSTKIATQAAAACQAISRPNGSGAGRTALLNSLNAAAGAGDGCIQGSRSSSAKGSTQNDTPNLVYVPYATEAITYAISNTSNISKALTFVQLQAFFQCTRANLIQGGSPYTTGRNYRAMLPQNGSGTRSYWISQMYPSSSGIIVPDGPAAVPTTVNCVQNNADEGGVLIEEHNGTQLNNFEIVPFSVAQYESQVAGVIQPDVRGPSRLGQLTADVDPDPAVTTNFDFNPFSDDFTLTRPLFNVFPEKDVFDLAGASSAGPAIRTLFVGGTSQICTNVQAIRIIKRFGLRVAANCGDTSSIS